MRLAQRDLARLVEPPVLVVDQANVQGGEVVLQLGQVARPGHRDQGGGRRQLSVLFEGVTALSMSLIDSGPADDARAAATTLINAATSGG